ncbi:MAG: oligopeptide/dipeptide ABC transporter ATP-binding protein, partial [bacterium]
ITHDLGVVANMADDIAVMYAGKIVEQGTAEDIFYDPRHPYTWGLLSAMPDLETEGDELYTIPGSPPNITKKIVGDAFAPRNAYALNIDLRLEPPMFPVGDSPTHKVASWLMHPKAPKVSMPESLALRIEKMKKEGATIRE